MCGALISSILFTALMFLFSLGAWKNKSKPNQVGRPTFLIRFWTQCRSQTIVKMDGKLFTGHVNFFIRCARDLKM